MLWMLTLRRGLFLPYFTVSNHNFVTEKQCWGDVESEAKNKEKGDVGKCLAFFPLGVHNAGSI